MIRLPPRTTLLPTRRSSDLTKNFVPGADVSSNSLVTQVKALPQELRNTETVRYAEVIKKHKVEMIGTYSTIPELNWTVIAQRSEEHTSEFQSPCNIVCLLLL